MDILTRLSLVIGGLAVCGGALAREIAVPLQVEHSLIEHALRKQVYTGPGGAAQPWDDGSGCNYLTLTDPHVDSEQGKLRVRSNATARIGKAFGDQCFVALEWSGVVETLETLVIDPAKPVIHVRVIDSRLLDRDGQPARVSNTLWEWVKEYVHPKLETMAVDLTPAVGQLKGFLPLLLPGRDAEQTQRMLDSLQFAAAEPNDSGVRVRLRLDVADRPPAPPAGPEPELTPDEIAQWQNYLDSWDSFYTYIIKHAAADTKTGTVQRDLLEVLLDTRFALGDVVAQPNRPGFDPVRSIFVETWERLTPILRQIEAERRDQRTSINYLSFVTAGDALRALDEAGPAIGVDISLDGLRRMARMVAPEDSADPLDYDTVVDPQLRDSFGFGEPLPPAEENPELDLLNWLFPPVWADDAYDSAKLKKLNGWAPARAELDSYLPMVRDLLKHSAAATLKKTSLDPEFHSLYATLVLSTAWQESCWRQFVKRKGKLVAMKSQSGSIGIMQINPRVWRGFYDVKGIKGDIGYNAMAGSEIVMHYLADYAIAKGEHKKTGKLDNLARASYSAYNAGPRQLARYRNAKATAREKRVDQDFWEKYQAIKQGDELAVAQCFGD